ncbi:hypothetical protein GXW82_03320 [Streptacidiphilus sp. 4-A2]|nr:hypothetical protein [Streptacidiphilus sp. 4-A2]
MSVFIEIGPDATLSGMGLGLLETTAEPGQTAGFVPLLRPGRPRRSRC